MTAITRDALDAALTTPERERRAELEAIVHRGLRAFQEVANALVEIRDARLYRNTHETFEAYVEEAFGFSRAHAYRYIKAAEVMSPLGDTGLPMPANERQARALAEAPVELRPEAWRVATEDGERQPTAAQVTEAVATVTGKAAGPLPFEEGDDDSFPFDLDGEERAPDLGALFKGTGVGRDKPKPEPEAPRPLKTANSVEWYTPARFIEAVHAVLGGIDLDPASCEQANATVGALNYFTEADDGLGAHWFGSVYVNPPYGKDGNESRQRVWGEKLIAEYEAGRTSEAIGCFAASPDTAIVQRFLTDYAVCFVEGRIDFDAPPGQAKGSPANGTIFVYLGPNEEKFAREFGGLGAVVRRV